MPLSIGAAVPSIQWCSVGWDQVESACFAECTAAPHRVCMGAAGAASGCEGASCEGMASAAHEEPPATCPMRSRAGGEPRSSGRGRAYCLDDPAGTASSRPAPIFALDPHALAAFLPAAPGLDAPTEHPFGPPPRGIARPPTRGWEPIPPARAPPAERST